MQRISSFIRYIGRGGFALLCLGGALPTLAQPYEPIILYDVIGDTNQRIGEFILESLGDQNGDGFSDFIFNVGGQGGNLRLIYGSGESPMTTLDFAHLNLDTSTASYNWLLSRHNTGMSLNSDYTGDGITDILIDLNKQSDGDTVLTYLFIGGGGPEDFDTIWHWRAYSILPSLLVTGLGDFDANGTVDFTRSGGAWNEDFLWFMNWSWPNPPTEPTWAIHRPGPGNDGNFYQCQGVGDVTGDGWPDFMHFIYYPDFSRHYEIWYGGSEADSVPDFALNTDTLEYATCCYGIYGDINGDGVADLGSYIFDSFAPRTGPAIYYGRTPLNVIEPDLVLEHHSGEDISPLSAQVVGDINDDGFNELAFKDINRGSCYLFLGGNPMDSLWSFYLPEGEFDGFRTSLVRGIGDFNGDGIDDWAISSYEDWFTRPRRGRVTVFAGDRNWGVPVTNEQPIIPYEFSLSVYPNPFNSTLSISLDVPLYRDVTLLLYDLLGREVDVVYRGRLSSSTLSYVAPAALGSGVYFLRASAGEQAVLRKVVLLK